MSLVFSDLCEALGVGRVSDDLAGAEITDVVIDSRLAVPGCLFVALKGEHTDGHLFVEDAFERGALVALIEVDLQGPWPVLEPKRTTDQLDTEPPLCVKVTNTLEALQELSGYWRRRHAECRVVGITGSVGKTTTKELVASVLRQRFVTICSEGNYNNEIGLPLTLLRLHGSVEWAVQEMGMYDLGEISRLAELARPTVGVVTNVGPTHLERLGTLDRIAQAKAELVAALPQDGLAVLNGDDPRVLQMAEASPTREVVSFGLGAHNNLRASDVETLGLEGLRLSFQYGNEQVHVRLPLLGRHSVYGALAAAAVGLKLGLGWDEIVKGLRDPSSELRMAVLPGLSGSTLLDDTYNASPASTIAALNLLAEMSGRKVAVLGDMLELGSYEAEGHRLVGRRAAEVAEQVVVVGLLGRLIGEESLSAGLSASQVHFAKNNEEAVSALRELLQDGDFVLVKGSRGMAMERIVQPLVRCG